MMEEMQKFQGFLDHLEVGISLTTWRPDDPSHTEFLFVNAKRCRMTGHTREEVLSQPPIDHFTRETRAQFDRINAVLVAQGHYTLETTLRHRSNVAVPVHLYLKLIPVDGRSILLVEIHDISSFKKTESLLELSRDGMREMLTVIDKEKEKISQNVKSNLGLVLFPLISQLRITASAEQKEVLDILVGRIGHIARAIGVAEEIRSSGFNLTKRQILICELIRDGMTSKEIAQALGCMPSTINNHRNLIRKKLKLSGKSINLQAFLNSPDGGGP